MTNYYGPGKLSVFGACDPCYCETPTEEPTTPTEPPTEMPTEEPPAPTEEP